MIVNMKGRGIYMYQSPCHFTYTVSLALPQRCVPWLSVFYGKEDWDVEKYLIQGHPWGVELQSIWTSQPVPLTLCQQLPVAEIQRSKGCLWKGNTEGHGKWHIVVVFSGTLRSFAFCSLTDFELGNHITCFVFFFQLFLRLTQGLK